MNTNKARIQDGRWFDRINIAASVIVLAVVLYPMLLVVSASFSSPTAILNGEVLLLPVRPSLMAYERVLKNELILSGFFNSVVYTLIGCVISLVLNVLAAYPMSRRDFGGRGLLTVVVTITMFFSGGIVPSYLVIKELKMLNSMWAVILPSALSAWNIILMRTFFQTGVPYELSEAGRLDGCSNFRLLTQIILPLSKPILAVIGLYYGVAYWNSYFSALLYLSSSAKYPLQLVLRDILLREDMSNMLDTVSETSADTLLMITVLKYAVCVVASAPVIALYPFLQKYFVKGALIGAIKG